MDFHLVKAVDAMKLEVSMAFVTVWVNVVAELDLKDKSVTNAQQGIMGMIVMVRLTYIIHKIHRKSSMTLLLTECRCGSEGSYFEGCNEDGKCLCRIGFHGLKCKECAPGYYGYPKCQSKPENYSVIIDGHGGGV